MALILAATGVVVRPSPAAADDPSWLSTINAQRVANELTPVRNNPAWTEGIRRHLVYLQQTPSSYKTGQYASAHTENPASPYYSAAGAEEGGRSNLTWGVSSDQDAIDSWLGAPFHAIGFFRSALTEVAFYRAPTMGSAGFDVIGGLAGSPDHVNPTVFPAPGTTTDLSTFTGESPDPTETCRSRDRWSGAEHPGLPLIAMLTTAPAAGLSAALSGPGGRRLTSTSGDLCIVTADRYVSSDAVYGPTGRSILAGDNAVLLIAKQPLGRGTWTASIQQPGAADVTWSFATTAAGVSYPAAPTAVHADAGDGAARVSWSQPGATWNVDRWIVTASPGGRTCTSTRAACTVTGLTNGTSYAFTVVATGPDGDSDPSRVPATATPLPAAVSTLRPSVTGSPRVGRSLTARPGSWSPVPTSLSYQWLVNEAPVSGANRPTYTPTAAARGKRVSVRVTASGADHSPGSATSAPTGVVAAGAILNRSAPRITGSPRTGHTLTVSAGSWSVGGLRVSYQWLRDGSVVRGAVARTYRLRRASRGHRMSARVTVARTGYTPASRTSASTAKVRR